MEEYLNFLRNNLNKTKVAVPDDYLDNYFKVIDKNGLKEIINDYDLWNLALSEIGVHYLTHIPTNEPQFIKLISAFLLVTDSKRKIDLLPLIVHLDQDNLFCNFLIENGFFKEIENELISLLETVNISINTHEVSHLHWESEIIEEYNEGIKNKNISQIYNLIEAIERGPGFIPNNFTSFAVFVLYKTSFHKLVSLLEKKEDMLTIIILIIHLPEEKKLRIATATNNILLKFEVLRQLFYFKDIPIKQKDIVPVRDIIISFSVNKSYWEQFLRFFIKFPSRARHLFQQLGLAINQLDNEKIEIFVECLRIDKHTSDTGIKALTLCFSMIENEAVKKNLSEMAYSKWLEYIETYDEYIDSIFIKDVIEIILFHTNNFLDESELIKKLDFCLNEIHEIDNQWFTDKTKQTNYFYKLMSKLFIYSSSENIKHNNRNEQIQDILDTNWVLKHEDSTDKQTTRLFYEFVLK